MKQFNNGLSFKIILLFLLFLALILDSTLISLPIAAAVCILLYILYPDSAILVVIFIAGLVLDMLRLSPLGSTPIFLSLACLLIFIYKNTFELTDLNLIVIILFTFTYVYALLFGYSTNVLVYVVMFMLSEGVVYYFNRRPKSLIANS